MLVVTPFPGSVRGLPGDGRRAARRPAAGCRPPAGGGRRSVPPRTRLRCPGPCPTGVGASRRPVRRSDSVDRGRQGRRPAPTSVPVRRPNWPCRGRRLPKVTSERVPGNADLPSSRRRAGRHPHPGAGRGRADPARSRLRHPVPVHLGQPARTALPRRARPPRVNRPPGLDTGSADRTCRPRPRGEQPLLFQGWTTSENAFIFLRKRGGVVRMARQGAPPPSIRTPSPFEEPSCRICSRTPWPRPPSP
jgi:hypothetical protein